MRFSPGCSCCGTVTAPNCCAATPIPATLFAVLTFEGSESGGIDGTCICWGVDEVKSVPLVYDPAQQAWFYTEQCSPTRWLGVFLYCSPGGYWRLRVAIYSAEPDVNTSAPTLISNVAGWDADGGGCYVGTPDCEPFYAEWSGLVATPCGPMPQAGWGCTYTLAYMASAVVTE